MAGFLSITAAQALGPASLIAGLGTAAKVMGATAVGSAAAAGVESAVTGGPFLDAFERNYNIAGWFFTGTVAYAGAHALVTGSSVYAGAGTNSIFQGYVELKQPPFGLDILCCGLTAGSAATFSGARSGEAGTWIKTTLAAHELGHTIQFVGLSAFGDPWLRYLGLGGLGLINRISNPWENLASLLGRSVP